MSLWRKRPASQRDAANAAPSVVAQAIHAESRGAYGARRIHAELREEELLHGVSRHRVVRLMRLHGLSGVHPCRGRGRRGMFLAFRHDHVAGTFVRDAPGRVRVADLKQDRSGEDWPCLAVVLELSQRNVVGWAMDDRPETELMLAALQTAQAPRRSFPGLMNHTDQGSVY